MNVTLTPLSPLLRQWASKFRPYTYVLAFLLFAAVYGFLVLRINTLSDPTLDESAITEAAKASPAPHLDKDAAQQFVTLKDNSVSVQTLFEHSRTNPF